jgi:hypothetical protein
MTFPHITRADGRPAYEAAPERLRQPKYHQHRFADERRAEWATTSGNGVIRLTLLCVGLAVASVLFVASVGWA